VIKNFISDGLKVAIIAIIQIVVLFSVQVTLARILEPSEFGVFAFISLIVMLITHFGNINGDKFLIKEKREPNKVLDTIFTFELIWSFFLICFSFFILPFILVFIGKESLTEYIQVFCLIIFYQPLLKPRALFEKELSFLKANIPMLISNIVGGVVGVIMAYNNYGIWSLVWWKLTVSFIEALLIWSILPYRPKLNIDYKILKKSISFGYPLLISGVLVFIAGNVDYYVVDFLLKEEALGFYWMAYQISHYLFFIRTGINKVLYPTLAKIGDLKKQIELFDMITVITSVLYFIPIFTILLFAQEIIMFVYGEKWLPSTVLLQIFSIIVLIKAVASNVGPLLHTYNYTKVDMEVAIINLFLMVPLTIFLTDAYDTIGAAIAVFLVGNISVFYTYQFYVKKLIHRGYLYYFLKILILLFACLFLIWLINYLFVVTLIHKAAVYLLLLFLLYLAYREDLKQIILRYNNYGELSDNSNPINEISSGKSKRTFIIYSGSHNVTLLGATRTTDLMIVKTLIGLGHKVIWVARGKLDTNICEYHNIGESYFVELSIRIYNKIKRKLFGLTINQQLFNEFVYYDKRLAFLIKSNVVAVDSNTVIIGRNGMSLRSFEEVKKRGGKSILHSQWMHPKSQQEYLRKEYKRIGIKDEPILEDRIERQLSEIEIVDKIWSISSLVENSYLSNNIKKDKLIDCALGVDFKKFNNLDKSEKNDEEFNILFVGNINIEKGPHILLKACLGLKSSRKINILFNGGISKNFKDIFDDYTDKLSNNNISVIYNGGGSPLKSYARSSIFVLPSVHESFGLVVLEAMAAGLPVVLSDNVGAKDCMKENINGFTFRKSDHTQLTEIIQKLINDKEMVKKMSKESERMAKRYDWSFIIKSLVDKIKDINL
tara:strand:- start:1254 stop:3914 length:2661 start_codon:yes stop_codon:yes gene_type:complete